MSAKDQALSRLGEARGWVGKAIAGLNDILGFNGQRSEIEGLPQFKAVKTHFHVSLGEPLPFFLRFLPFVDDPTEAVLKGIRFRYFDMLTPLARPEVFLDSSATDQGAAFVPIIRDGTIRITRFYPKVGPLNQVLVLVHEAAYFIGDEFQDYAYRDRTGEPEKRKYINLPVQYALLNADSCAYFALQMARGINRVLKKKE